MAEQGAPKSGPDLRCPLCGGQVEFYWQGPDVRCAGCGAQWDVDGKSVYVPASDEG